MNYLVILKFLLSTVNSYVTYLKNKDLIDAGIAQATLKGYEDVINKINIANDAIANVDSLPISQDPANRANQRQVRALPSANDTDV